MFPVILMCLMPGWGPLWGEGRVWGSGSATTQVKGQTRHSGKWCMEV